MSQKAALIEHFRSGGTLTVLEAIQQFGVYALSQRCTDLRRDGYPIYGDMVDTPTGKRVARYRWREPVQMPLEMSLLTSPNP